MNLLLNQLKDRNNKKLRARVETERINNTYSNKDRGISKLQLTKINNFRKYAQKETTNRW